MAVKIFGILNITEDSFSDGAKYLVPKAAIAHAQTIQENTELPVRLDLAFDTTLNSYRNWVG